MARAKLTRPAAQRRIELVVDRQRRAARRQPQHGVGVAADQRLHGVGDHQAELGRGPDDHDLHAATSGVAGTTEPPASSRWLTRCPRPPRPGDGVGETLPRQQSGAERADGQVAGDQAQAGAEVEGGEQLRVASALGERGADRHQQGRADLGHTAAQHHDRGVDGQRRGAPRPWPGGRSPGPSGAIAAASPAAAAANRSLAGRPGSEPATGDGRARGDGLEAAPLAALADRARSASTGRWPISPATPCAPAPQAAAEDEARGQPGPDAEVGEVGGIPMHRRSAEGGRVHVVLDEGGHARARPRAACAMATGSGPTPRFTRVAHRAGRGHDPAGNAGADDLEGADWAADLRGQRAEGGHGRIAATASPSLGVGGHPGLAADGPARDRRPRPGSSCRRCRGRRARRSGVAHAAPGRRLGQGGTGGRVEEVELADVSTVSFDGVAGLDAAARREAGHDGTEPWTSTVSSSSAEAPICSSTCRVDRRVHDELGAEGLHQVDPQPR